MEIYDHPTSWMDTVHKEKEIKGFNGYIQSCSLEMSKCIVSHLCIKWLPWLSAGLEKGQLWIKKHPLLCGYLWKILRSKPCINPDWSPQRRMDSITTATVPVPNHIFFKLFFGLYRQGWEKKTWNMDRLRSQNILDRPCGTLHGDANGEDQKKESSLSKTWTHVFLISNSQCMLLTNGQRVTGLCTCYGKQLKLWMKEIWVQQLNE